VTMTQAEALAETVDALRAAGRLENVDAATVAVAEGLAAAVDADPTNASLWRELRAAVETLRGVGAESSTDDAFAQAIASIMRPEVRDAAVAGSVDARPAGRRRR